MPALRVVACGRIGSSKMCIHNWALPCIQKYVLRLHINDCLENSFVALLVLQIFTLTVKMGVTL